MDIPVKRDEIVEHTIKAYVSLGGDDVPKVRAYLGDGLRPYEAVLPALSSFGLEIRICPSFLMYRNLPECSSLELDRLRVLEEKTDGFYMAPEPLIVLKQKALFSKPCANHKHELLAHELNHAVYDFILPSYRKIQFSALATLAAYSTRMARVLTTASGNEYSDGTGAEELFAEVLIRYMTPDCKSKVVGVQAEQHFGIVIRTLEKTRVLPGITWLRMHHPGICDFLDATVGKSLKPAGN